MKRDVVTYCCMFATGCKGLSTFVAVRAPVHRDRCGNIVSVLTGKAAIVQGSLTVHEGAVEAFDRRAHAKRYETSEAPAFAWEERDHDDHR